MVCPVDGIFSEVCLAETAANRRHNLPQSRGFDEHICYLVSSRVRKVLSVAGITAY